MLALLGGFIDAALLPSPDALAGPNEIIAVLPRPHQGETSFFQVPPASSAAAPLKPCVVDGVIAERSLTGCGLLSCAICLVCLRVLCSFLSRAFFPQTNLPDKSWAALHQKLSLLHQM